MIDTNHFELCTGGLEITARGRHFRVWRLFSKSPGMNFKKSSDKTLREKQKTEILLSTQIWGSRFVDGVSFVPCPREDGSAACSFHCWRWFRWFSPSHSRWWGSTGLTVQCIVLSSSQQGDRVGPSYSCDRYQVKSDIAADCRCGVGGGGAASHAPSHWRHRTRPHSSV